MDFNLTEDQLALVKTIKEFTKREVEPIAAQLDSSGRISDVLMIKMANLKLMGMVLPAEFGGANASHMNCILVC